jgi:carbon monoxide dehydrogenase subunit G
MKLSGSHKFKAPRAQVFNAILNPQVLKNCIPGCNSVEYLDNNRIKANITTPLPGLKGPYGIIINIANAQAPNYLELHVQRKGTGGAVKAVSQINLADEPDGTLLTYNANADLEGPISVADNPIGRGITNNSLGSFFKNLEKAIV